MGGLEIVGDQQTGPCGGSIHRGGPTLQVGATALFDEAQEVASKRVNRRRLQDRVDGFRDRFHPLLHLRAQRKPRVANAQGRQQDVLEIRDRRQQRPHELLFAIVGEVPAGEERQLGGRPAR